MRRKSIILALAVTAWAFFLLTTFRSGWMHAASDFPNYYTAAVLAHKRAPLRNYYDWTWFQRQVNYAGSNQLGAYVPQGPLTMVPLMPIAGLPVQNAKRVWMLFSLVCLAATFWLLSLLTRFSMAEISLLCFLGYGTLQFNFLYGQYYAFLLFLFALAYYALQRDRSSIGGLLVGAIFALKLYGGPFLLYLAIKRRWRAVAGFIAASLCLTLVAVGMFGWENIGYFGTHILPRALRGETLDPYNSLNGTLSTLLREAFMKEPGLNPQPLWNAPFAFFFLQPFLTLAILIFPLLTLVRTHKTAHDFAWFFVAVMLASPNTGSYTFLLLLLPVALLLDDATWKQRVLLVGCYALLAVPLRPSWSWLFPKVWLLVILFCIAGKNYWRLISLKTATAATAAIASIATILAVPSFTAYLKEPARHWEPFAVQLGVMLSTSPAVLRSGVVYQAMVGNQYVLCRVHQGRIQEFRFDGQALSPEAETPDGPIRFELVRGKQSMHMLFDPTTNKLTQQTLPSKGANRLSVVSPDGRWVAFVATSRDTEQIYLKSTNGGPARALTGGNCNSFLPAWSLDSQAIIFASDCNRGVGCPMLYRAKLDSSLPSSQDTVNLIDDFDHSKKLRHWSFSNGSEFPGASGALLLGPGHEGRGAILRYRFTCRAAAQCGHYVAAIWNPPSPASLNPGSVLTLWARLSPEVRLGVRVTDETGQILQFYPNAPSLEHPTPEEWQPIVIPITSNANGHWGGANSGRIAGRITAIAILADSRFPEAAQGEIGFDDLRLVADTDASFQLDNTAKLNRAPEAAAQLRPRWGVNIHFLKDDRALDIARDAGFSFVRMDLLWSELEKQGQYDFAPFDELMRAAEARGMGVLWILDYGHPEHGGKAPQSAEDISAYARYAAAVVAHFAGHNARFEVWNEPNIPGFLPDPHTYPELLRASLASIRAENPSALVSTAGISGFDFAFFKEMLESGSAQKASAIAMHPYRDAAPETLTGDLMLLHQLIHPTRGHGLPLWDTEWGYSSSGSWLKEIPPDGHHEAARIRQAQLAMRESLTVWALGLPVAVWYDLSDDGPDPFNREDNFGLLDQTNHDKPAITALRTLAAIARDHRYVGLVDNLPFGTHAMRLDGDDTVFVVWTEGTASQVYAQVPRQKFLSANDLFGRTISADRSDGEFEVFRLKESAGPIYFRMKRQ